MAKKLPNIVFFGIDSIRRDHMSCYGYERQTTPHFDKLAEKSVLFENNFSPWVPTTSAYVAMLTGMDQITTQVVALRHEGDLNKDFRTLPEILKDKGYKSVCVGHGDFYRGFDEYLDYSSWGGEDESQYSPKAGSMNKVVLPKLDELAAADEPFLMFMRHMDPHTPYLPPPPFNRMFYTEDEFATDREDTMQPVWDFKPFAGYFKGWLPDGITDIDYVDASYDGALAYMDACCQQIIQRIQELGITEETIIVVNGDHGETLQEHGCWFDHHGMYEPNLVVPLILHWPGHLPEGQRVKGYTHHIDLVPTLLEIAGIDAPDDFDGISQMPMVRGEKETNYTEFYITECTWMRKHGWRTTEWKYIEALEPDFHGFPPTELYNLIEDPLELNNLVEKEPGLAAELKRRMYDWLEKREKETGKKPPIYSYELGLGLSIGSVDGANKLQTNEEDEEE
jgi:arylsulfatase A-like enzyme